MEKSFTTAFNGIHWNLENELAIIMDNSLFWADMVDSRILSERQKATCCSENSAYKRASKLIEILKMRNDEYFNKFIEILNKYNLTNAVNLIMK